MERIIIAFDNWVYILGGLWLFGKLVGWVVLNANRLGYRRGRGGG